MTSLFKEKEEPMTYSIENAFYDMRHVGRGYWIVTLHGRTVFRGLFHECMSWIDQRPPLFPTVTKKGGPQ